MADQPAYRSRPRFYGPQGLSRTQASLRASDADREQLVDVLKGAFAEGRLSQDEYTERMERAYTAKTYGELALLSTDLPAQMPPTRPTGRRGPTHWRSRRWYSASPSSLPPGSRRSPRSSWATGRAGRSA